MLIIDVGNSKRELSPKSWFKHVFDWDILLEDDFIKRMVKEVSKCDIIGPNLVVSEVLGPVSPEWIGDGCKAVIAMKYADPEEYGIVDLCWVGDNLIPYIREVCKDKDVEVTCDRLFPYLSERYGKFDGCAMVKNSGKVFTDCIEMYDEMDKFMEC